MKPEFWNDKYSSSKYLYGLMPNRFLALMLENRPAGRILFPAEGEGRNAVYAAKLGWEVYAFDQSKTARDKALALAEQEGVEIRYDLSDIMDYEPQFRFDAVALIYAHLPVNLRKSAHQKLASYLKPVGELWLEAFAPGQLNFTSGGPKLEAMLYTPEMIENDFHSLQIRQSEIKRYELNEGPGHSGMGEVLRFRAVK
jgi:SAM-dependent methyltransferase